MNFSARILGIGYLLLSLGSSPVQTSDDCECWRDGKNIKNEIISVTREDVVKVSCTKKSFAAGHSREVKWITKANSQSYQDERKSTLKRILTIKSASVNASRGKFFCRLKDDTFRQNSQTCCKVIIKIDDTKTTISSTVTTTMKTPTATSQQERHISTTADMYSVTPTNHLQKRPNNTTTEIYSHTAAYTNRTFPTSQQERRNAASRQSATISAAVSATASLLIGVGIAVIVALIRKRKRRSDDYISNESTDNLTYSLDVKEEKIWSGNNIIPNSCLSVGKSLGKGHFGTVAQGTLRTTTKQGDAYYQQIAIKMLTEREELNAEELQKEAEIIVNLGRHENVILVYGYCIEKQCVSKIVMEYADLGDLHRYLRKLRSDGLDDAKQFAFGQQIAEGMNFVVSKGCVHRDLAARNVLVCAGQRLKISDFGLAKDLQSAAYYRKTSRGGVIPFRWCAPEVLLYQTYSEYSDVWSYGIVLWEIATMGGTPYPGIPVEKLFHLLTGKSGYRLSQPRNCSKTLYDVMVRCWNSIPDTRPTFFQITSEYLRTYDE
ncbi:fibroblast growth factor receptor 3-like [Oscarella lobularis]|uniref:fibroblast growth factor receptor 3-like n=1 Tax=Oscarella lobularis TaxID=121494 RepID=UPI0033132DD6